MSASTRPVAHQMDDAQVPQLTADAVQEKRAQLDQINKSLFRLAHYAQGLQSIFGSYVWSLSAVAALAGAIGFMNFRENYNFAEQAIVVGICEIFALLFSLLVCQYMNRRLQPEASLDRLLADYEPLRVDLYTDLLVSIEKARKFEPDDVCEWHRNEKAALEQCARQFQLTPGRGLVLGKLKQLQAMRATAPTGASSVSKEDLS